MTPERADALIRKFTDLHVLVLGDIMLAEFVWGKVTRISPEAPVPVVEVQSSSTYPGGAANVVRNLAPFTRRTAVVGAVGTDRFGERLRDLLRESGTDTKASPWITGRLVRSRPRHTSLVATDRSTPTP